MYIIKSLLLRATQALVIGMLLTIVVVLSAQIIARYIFELPLVWSEELVLVLLVWITFLGSALVLEKKGHINIDFALRLFPERLQRAIELCTAALMVVFCGILVFGGWIMVTSTLDSNMPGLKISVAWLYGGTLLGGVLMFLTAIEQFIQHVRPASTQATLSEA